ncbi:MAG: tetratricopeptide repeat protein, partial [candidate division KSB1 bacterium]|nr:tetratricopeptide repeat protein [candidate division KSB1 bacterium]
MLDKQFFRDEQFHPYLTQNFLLFRAHRGTPVGEEIYKRFSVRATPTVMVVTPDGKEIDRVLGYDPPPTKFKDTLEKSYRGENTLLSLMQAHEKDPSNVAVLARLAEKYRFNYAFDKMAEFAQKILTQPETAKQIMLPFGKDSAKVSAYEFARFAATFSGPEAVLEFATEFPNSGYLDEVFGDFWRSLLNKDQSEKAIPIFDQLLAKFPQNTALVGSYLNYCIRSKTNFDRGLKLADRIYKLKDGKVDLDFARAYAEILMEKGVTQKVEHLIQELVKNNPDQAIDIEMQVGFLYQQKKQYDNAIKTFESVIKHHPDYYPAYYQIGRTAVFSGTNLDRGIECLKIYLQHEPLDGQPTWANSHFRLGALYELKGDKAAAQNAYETALKLDP